MCECIRGCIYVHKPVNCVCVNINILYVFFSVFMNMYV